MKATKRVSMPTRPTNMVVITTILPAELNAGVMPKLRPDVVYAEIDSNKSAVVSKVPSVTLRKIKHSKMLSMDSSMIANALLTDSGNIRRPKISIDSLPRASATTLSKASAMVVTFTPPPVEPGEDPTHISVTDIINVGIDNNPTPTVSNPAVREELAIKNAVVILPKKLSSATSVRWYSNTKKDTVARTITTALQ